MEGKIISKGNINIDIKVEYILKIFTNSDKHFQKKLKKKSKLKNIILNCYNGENNNLIKEDKNANNNQSEKKKNENNGLTKEEKNKNENSLEKKENSNLTQKSEKSIESTQIEEKSIEDSLKELPFIPISNFNLENVMNSNIKFINEDMSSLDYIYFSIQILSNPFFKQIFKEIIKDPQKLDLLCKISQKENNEELKKFFKSKEFKEILDNQNIFHFLIKEGFNVIDPYEEINYLEKKIPYKVNFKSVKLFSDFIDKEKIELNNNKKNTSKNENKNDKK